MDRKIFKVIGFGILIGVVGYFAPGILLFMFLFFGLTKLFGRRRYRHYKEYQLAYAEKLRGMSDDEFQIHQESIKDGQRHC